MNKLSLHSPLAYQPNAQSVVEAFPPVRVNTTSGTIRRFIVLVPPDTEASAARRIWELAHAAGMQVQLISLYKEVDDEPALRRKLVTMAALIQDGTTCAQVKLFRGANWVEAVKMVYQTGDVIVCFAEQRAGWLGRSLSQILESNLGAPVYILSDASSQHLPASSWFSQFMAWVGSIGIIIGLFFLQIQIMSLSPAWVQTTLLIFSIITEVWLIRIWNGLFG